MQNQKKRQIRDPLLASGDVQPGDTGQHDEQMSAFDFFKRFYAVVNDDKSNKNTNFEGGSRDGSMDFSQSKKGKYSLIQPDFLGHFKEQLKDIEDNDRFFTINEPRKMGGKIRAIIQNLFEIIIYMIILIIASN